MYYHFNKQSYVDVLKAENAEKEREKEEKATFSASIGTLFVGSSPAKQGGTRSHSSPSRARSHYSNNTPTVTSSASSAKIISSPTPLSWPPASVPISPRNMAQDAADGSDDIDAELIEHQAPGGPLETLSTSFWDALPIDHENSSFSVHNSPDPASDGASKVLATS